MDIVKSNFKDAFKIFTTILKQSSLIALDLEMTGIRGRPERITDTGDERYDKCREVAQKFRIIQFGITLFVKEKDEYKAYPFNAYVIQDECYRQGYMGLEMGALQFLTEHGMDFNKWIKEGVPYVGKLDELNFMKEETNDTSGEMIELTEKKYQEETEKELANIEKWMKDDTQGSHFIPGVNSYIRKYYYQQMRKKYPNCILEHSQVDKTPGIIIYKVLTEKEKAEYNAKKQEELWTKLGFRNVFKALCESHLPVVGHNCFYDFLFLYSTFEEILPNSLFEYKELLSKLFVEIYDTKLLFTDKKIAEYHKLVFPDTVLDSIYAVLVKQELPKITFGEGFDKYAKTSQCHEAGYDSYITGFSFLKMQEILKDATKKYKGLINCYNGTFSFNMLGDDPLKADTVVIIKGKDLNVYDVYKKLEDFKQYATIRVNDDKNAIIIMFDLHDSIANSKGKELLLAELAKDDKIKILTWKDYSEKRAIDFKYEDKGKYHNKKKHGNRKDH